MMKNMENGQGVWSETVATIKNGNVLACHIETTEHCQQIGRNFHPKTFRKGKPKRSKTFFEHDNRLPRKFFPLNDSEDSGSPITVKSFVSHDFPNAKITFPAKGQKAMYMNSKMRRVVQYKQNRMRKKVAVQNARCCCHCACFKKPTMVKCNTKTHVVKGRHPRGMNRTKRAKFNGCKSIRVRETHQIAAAQQQKNAKLREAFGISEYFMEGSSLDPERKAKEDLAKSMALQAELLAQKEMDRMRNKKYTLVKTPSPEREEPKEKKKKKKKSRDL